MNNVFVRFWGYRFMFFVVLVSFFVLNFFPFVWLSADSFHWLRLNSVVLSNGMDYGRTFPLGNLEQSSYFLVLFDWFKTVLSHVGIGLESAAFVWTYLITILDSFLIGLIVFKFTSDKKNSVLASILFLVMPITKIYTTFDTQSFRLFWLLTFLLFIVHFKEFLVSSKKSFAFTTILIITNIIIFKSEILTLLNSIFNLSQYKNIIELQSPTPLQFIFAYPNFFLTTLFLLSFLLFFVINRKKFSENIILLFIISVTTTFFLYAGMMMTRFNYYYSPLAIIFVCTIFAEINNCRNFGWFKKINGIYLALITILLVNGFLFHTPTHTLFNDPELQETTQFLKQYQPQPILIIDNWDMSYYWQYKTNAKTLIDGGTFTHSNAKLLADLYLLPEQQVQNLAKNFKQQYNIDTLFVYSPHLKNTRYALERMTDTKYTPESFVYKLETNYYNVMPQAQKFFNMTLLFKPVFKSQTEKFIIYKINE